MATLYWVGGSDDWGGPKKNKWSLTSGGSGGENHPGPADDVFFDANSGAVTVPIKNPSKDIRSINFTGFTGTINDSADINVGGGDVTMGSGMTNSWTGELTMSGTGASRTLTSNGISFGGNIVFDGSGSTFTLADALTTTGEIRPNQGTFNTGNFAVSCAALNASLGTGTRAVTLGSSTVTLTSGDTNPWDATGLTVNAGTSTITMTGTLTAQRNFVGNSQTYYIVDNSTTGSFAILFSGDNTFTDFTVDANRDLLFTAGSTNTFADFSPAGAVTINSDTLAQHFLVKTGGGTIDLSNSTITYSNASPSETWHALTDNGNTNGGNNTGWVFSEATNNSDIIMAHMAIAGGLM